MTKRQFNKLKKKNEGYACDKCFKFRGRLSYYHEDIPGKNFCGKCYFEMFPHTSVVWEDEDEDE